MDRLDWHLFDRPSQIVFETIIFEKVVKATLLEGRWTIQTDRYVRLGIDTSELDAEAMALARIEEEEEEEEKRT